MPTIFVDDNEYQINTYETGSGAKLEDGLQLVIEEDGSGEQRASIWGIPGRDKHVISLQRGASVPGSFDEEFEFQVTGSDAEALRSFLAKFPQMEEARDTDYVILGEEAELGSVISRLSKK